MGPHLDQDNVGMHTSYTLFEPQPHVTTLNMNLGVTEPLCLLFFLHYYLSLVSLIGILKIGSPRLCTKMPITIPWLLPNLHT